MSKIKVGAVSYLNTKPLLYGIEASALIEKIELNLAYPAQLVQQLKEGSIDMALMPVAALQEINGAKIVADYGIAANGNVVSVALFSVLPLDEIDTIILDYQSRTSVRLTQLLCTEYWHKEVRYVAAGPDFISEIKGKTAGVIIGDRALEQLPHFKYNYDLSAAWKSFTGLPFVFAAWVSNKELPQDFLEEFNAAMGIGLEHLDEIAAANHIPYYSLKTYYKDNICYHLGEAEKKGLALFLEKISSPQNL
jgi:chorismate dehydratase